MTVERALYVHNQMSFRDEDGFLKNIFKYFYETHVSSHFREIPIRDRKWELTSVRLNRDIVESAKKAKTRE